MYLKHGAYYFVDRSGKWHRLGRDYVRALTAYAELNVRVMKSTLGAVIERYLVEVIPTKAPRTQRDNLKELKLLKQAFGHMAPDEITPQDIYAYMDARKAPVRANREKALLSHVFSYAIRWGKAEDNPCRLVKGNKEKPRSRYISDDEFCAVYEIAPPVVRVAMMISYITGLRQGDVLALSRNNIGEEGLEVKPAKSATSSGQTMLFTWTAELKGVVDQAKALRGDLRSIYLICNQKGQRYTSNGFHSMWRNVMGKALKDGVIEERFTFHDIRAKAASDSEDAHLLGHQDQSILNRVYKRKAVRVKPLTPKILDKG